MKKSILISNHGAPVQKIQSLVCNLLPNKCRLETLEGREYTVVPMVILTEGVHHGSDGALYYPPEELEKTPAVWNHKPIVVYHPEMNGQGISACDPVVINSRKVGLMMNTVFEKGRLKSEAWLEPARANLVDERIMAAVTANEMMELSTGVFIDVDGDAGEWKGEAYVGIARNYRPDHLALLPDKVGACSIADGAGLLRNQDNKKNSVVSVLTKALRAVGLASNELSFSNIRETLSDALCKKHNINQVMGPIPYNGPWLYVEDVYSNFVIYELGDKLFRLGYSSSDTGVELSADAPVEVVRVTEYRTVTGTFVGNRNPKQNQVMNKKKLIGILLANAVTTLNGVTLAADMNDEQLGKINDEQLEAALNDLVKNSKQSAAPATVTPAVAAAKPAVVANAGATTASPKVLTVTEFVQTAPPEMQAVLNNSLSVYNEEKAKLVAAIVANKNNGFTKEDLEGRPLGELKNLARLAAVEVAPATAPANYGGQAPVPTGNEAEEAMEVPVMNFDSKK